MRVLDNKKVLISNFLVIGVLIIINLYILSVHPAIAVRGPEITAVEVSSARKYTRVIIEFSASPVSLKIKKNGFSIDVFFRNCSKRSDLRMPAGQGVIDTVSVNHRLSDSVLNIKLKKNTEYNAYQLPRYLNRPDRVVINFKNPESVLDQIFSKIAGKKHVVVIDAGHGGKDPGALGLGKLHEKDIVLDVAKQIVSHLSTDESIKCVLTRDSDEFIKLSDRVKISKNSGSALFMSIHCNSSSSKSARGAEVFYLSDKKASDAAANLLAKKENASFEIGLDTFDKSMDENVLKILIDMKKNFVMTQSRNLAAQIAVNFRNNKYVNMDRGVRRAGFMVLKAVSVPSVLVELGFISNSRECKLLESSWYRVSIARSLAEAIKSYLKDRDTNSGIPSLSSGGKKYTIKG